MHLVHASTLIAAAYLTIGAIALPNPRPAATYQVVNVGGPSSSIDSPPAETFHMSSSTIEEPKTVTQAITVTAEPTATARPNSTVTIVNTERPVYSTTITMSPLPVIVSDPTPSTATETVTLAATETIYNTVPIPAYATAIQTISVPSFMSSPSSTHIPTLRGPFNYYGAWNQTLTATTYPSAGTYARYPTGASCPNELGAARSTGVYVA